MKKLISIICMFVLAFTLVSCKDKTIKMENGVLMTLNEELKANITMNTSAPQLMFNYEGTYNVYETSSLLGYIFTKNDNFKLSKDFENHLKQFKDSYCVVSEIVQEYDEPNAVFGEQRVPLDSNTKSVEYTIVVWDTDGTLNFLSNSIFKVKKNKDRKTLLCNNVLFKISLKKITEEMHVSYCLVATSRPTLCDPMDCSSPGIPALPYLPEVGQI